MSAQIPEIVRFVKFIDVRAPRECWPWTGSTFPSGYGSFFRQDGTKATASRVSYELLVAPFDDELKVLHRCDNPICVNPNHLFLGTSADNAQDREAKGRGGNSKKTHCPKGHPYDAENTYVRTRDGKRGCRICRSDADRLFKLRRKERREIGPNERADLDATVVQFPGVAA